MPPEEYMRQADAWVVYTGTCRPQSIFSAFRRIFVVLGGYTVIKVNLEEVCTKS